MREKIVSLNFNKRAEQIMHKQKELMLFATELASLFPDHPHIRWEKAAFVPWQEIIRKPDMDEEAAPENIRNEVFGSSENRWNYWSNQLDVRRMVLQLVADFLDGEVTREEMKKHLINGHTQLILGEKGDTPYQPPTYITFGLEGQLDPLKTMTRKLGLTNNGIDKLRDNLSDVIGGLNNPENSIDDIKDSLYEFQRIMIVPVFDKECMSAFPFAFGNNSFSMNHINALLRLFGREGISHDGIDFALLANRETPKKAYNHFIAILFEGAELNNGYY